MTKPRKRVTAPAAAGISEAQFTTTVIDLARLLGWLAFHQLPAQHRAGKWSSATQGDTGFPDLILLRERLVVAELKVSTSLHGKQRDWLQRFQAAGVETYVWKPKDLGLIQRVLAR